MPYDYSLLCGRITTICKTQGVFAKRMGISEHTISKKLNGLAEWKQSEILKACEVLCIALCDIPLYFFATQVQGFGLCS